MEASTRLALLPRRLRSPTSTEFLANDPGGRCEAAGEGGTPLALAHGTYSAAYPLREGEVLRAAE